MYKTFLYILFCFITTINSYSQKPIEIYKNEFFKKDVKLSKTIKANQFEKDSLVLFDNGTFEKFYEYSFYGEFDSFIIKGIWEKENNQLVLRPKTLTDNILPDKKNILQNDIIILVMKKKSIIKYQKKENRVIKQLKKVNFRDCFRTSKSIAE